MKKMKSFIINTKFLLLIFISTNSQGYLFGQLNEKYVDDLFQLIITERIKVYDDELNIISLEKEQWNKLIKIDTIVNDQWTRPRFRNNIFQKGIDGVIVKTKVEVDSITFISNPRFIQFVKKEFDKNGNFLFWETIFLLKRNAIQKPGKIVSKVSFPKMIVSQKNEVWDNDLIKINEEKIHLDSCHFSYQLRLYDDFSFTQSYAKRGEKCFTKEMKNEIEVGVESDFNMKYFDQLQGHYIDLPKGIWKVRNNFLYLFSREKRDFLKFKILKISKEELILETSNSEIYIKLKKRNF